MSDIRPNAEPTFDLDENDEPKVQGPPPEDGMREMPTDPPAVMPSIGAEQPAIFAGMGLSGFAKADPAGGFVQDDDEQWKVDRTVTDEQERDAAGGPER